ncbi:MAG: hypothetical protein KJP00_03180 [Bacteroidia bacterium]|nr:hypothetical protein [Bacteroidia bacterium]
MRLLSTVLIVFTVFQLSGQPEFDQQQQAILDVITALSTTTAKEGGGADAYGLILHDDYSRWTLGGEQMSGKQAWIDGIREWFDGGWSVSDRDQEIIEITVNAEIAFVRRIVSETFVSPHGNKGQPSKAALAEIWKKVEDQWLLYRVDITVL